MFSLRLRVVFLRYEADDAAARRKTAKTLHNLQSTQKIHHLNRSYEQLRYEQLPPSGVKINGGVVVGSIQYRQLG